MGGKEGNTLSTRAIQIGFLAAVGLIWYWLAANRMVTPLFLPRPDVVWRSFVGLVSGGQFWSAVSVTLTSIIQAYAIAVASGLLVGYLVSRSRYSTKLFEPLIAASFAVPITLFFPIFILVFGIGPASKVAYGAVYGFFPVALNTIAGFSGVGEHYIKAAKSMGASQAQMFRHVLLPAAFPVVVTGLRISFFICFASVLGGEAISSASGVGNNIAHAAELMEPGRMFAWIVFVIVTAIILNMIVSHVENRAGEH